MEFHNGARGALLWTVLLGPITTSATPVSQPSQDGWSLNFRTSNTRVLAASDDKFKTPPQTPPLFNDTPESILKGAHALMDSSKATADAIVAGVTPEQATFANVMLPMVQDDNLGTLAQNLFFYQSVSPDAALRNASNAAETMVSDFAIEAGMRSDVFALVDAVYKKRETAEKGLDAESLRLLVKGHKGFISNGLALPDKDRETYKALRTRIANLESQYNKNYNEQNEAVWFTPEELVGVSAESLKGLESGTGENQGKLRVTFKYTDQDMLFQFAESESTRQKYYLARENMNKANVPLEKEAVVLRDTAARLLGYPNHAAFIIEDNMAHDVPTVTNFLNDLRTKLTTRGKTEAAHLTEIKAAELKARNASSDGNFYYWDRTFYETIQVANEYSVNSTLVSEYFPIEHTIQAMLHIYEELFGFVFVELKPEDRDRLSPTGKGRDLVWHDDVIFFAVWDAENSTNPSAAPAADAAGFAGYLYMDLHPRPNKYGHAANFNLQPGFVQKDGSSRHYPATALVCNLSKPTATRPALLLHDEVVTLFHELGHGIHDLSGRTRYARFHGTNTVRDFVEAPSQMLENWCWTPSTLKRLAVHYKTGEGMPDDLITKLIATKHINDGISTLRQLFYGIFDQTIHTPAKHEDVEKMDLGVLYNSLNHEIGVLKGPEDLGMPSSWGNGQASFAHLMGGYDARYYSYLWSQVYSADMFYTAFKANPLDGTVGRRYRHTVLEKGGSQDETLSLEQFLGRKPNSEAFFKELGL